MVLAHRPAVAVVTLVAMLGLFVALTGIVGRDRRRGPVPVLASE